MKIAMIGHKRIPSREGGVEVVVEELSTRLVQQGHQVDVYNRKGKNVQDKNADRQNKKLKNYKGVNIITIPTINKKGLDALIYSFFASIRASFGKYDVLHYHAEGSCAMLWIPHLFRKRIVVTIHGLDWQRSKWGGFATKYIKFGEKLAVEYADEIIVLSKGVQKYFKDTYNRETNFIPNGVNKPVIREAKEIKEKWNLEKDNYILFLARIVPEKGLHYLIDAFKQIKTDKKLVIVGGSSYTNDYLEQIKKMVKGDNRIILTGFVQGATLDELFSNCYIYCLPSDVEGMPISLLEAIGYGRKCLVSDINENKQVIEGTNSITFKKGDVQDLKEKLQKVIYEKNNDLCINKDLFEIYNWDCIAKKTEKVYSIKEKKMDKLKICFAASTGGHFEQLMMLKPLMEKYNSFVLTEKTTYNVKEPKDIKVYQINQVNRKEILFPIKMLINTIKSFIIFIKEKPDLVITTGVLAMIPMCLLVKLFGKRLIYIESFAKISSPTMTGKFLYKYADQFYVQWERMLTIYPKAIYKGGIY